jgi:heme/copper-type cytochrome/quinol oxidase subunit 2
MRAKVIVESESDYKNWINEQETFSDLIAKQESKIKTTLIAKNDD